MNQYEKVSFVQKIKPIIEYERLITKNKCCFCYRKMLSDETITNFRLHRDTRLESTATPFVVPTNGHRHVPVPKQQQPQQRTAVAEQASSSRTSKSIIDAKNRAISDSCMAAAIGDLQWLKQSIRDGPLGSGEVISVEQTYGKDV